MADFFHNNFRIWLAIESAANFDEQRIAISYAVYKEKPMALEATKTWRDLSHARPFGHISLSAG